MLEKPLLTENVNGPELTITANCNTEGIHDARVELVWTGADFEGQRIDLSQYYQGFEQQMFVSLWPIDKENKFLSQPATEKLIARETIQNSLSPEIVDIRIDKDNLLKSVSLRKLDPGVVYYWRVCNLTEEGWIPGPAEAIQIPVCPMDNIDTE